jgi:hypothetical protein
MGAGTRGITVTRLVGLAGCVTIVLACEAAFQNRVGDARIATAQIAALPIGRVAYTLDSFDARVEKEEWANGMEGFMVPVLQRFVTGCGGRVVEDREVEECPPCARLSKWVASAGMEVAAHKAGRGETGRRSVGDWVYTGDVTPVQKALAAKIALVVAFKDTRDAADAGTPPPARAEAAAWKKLGVACLVDLVDGRMLWCEAREDSLADLTNLAGARRAMEQLLTPIFSGLNPSCAAPSPP